MSSFDKIVGNNRLITFVGTGGVGKTTLSLAFAIKGAMEGKRVAAITIDPSRRLSQILGVDKGNDGQFQADSFSQPMDVFFVDTEKVFRDFVSKNLSPALFDKIGSNKIFQQISKNHRETHNFAAIYKAVQVLNRQEYDLVILDTPPCHQVMEFFEAPGRLQSFFGPKESKERSGVTQWVQRKSLQVVEGVFSTFVGKDFVEEVDSFFKTVGSLRAEVHNVTSTFLSRLGGEDAKLALIFASAKDKVVEAEFLRESLSKQGHKVDSFILNRAFIPGLDLGNEVVCSKDSNEYKYYNFYGSKKKNSFELMREISAKFEDDRLQYLMLPEQSFEMKDVQSLLELSDQIFASWIEVSK